MLAVLTIAVYIKAHNNKEVLLNTVAVPADMRVSDFRITELMLM